MKRRLKNGVEIPEIGLGVYQIQAGEEMDRTIAFAAEYGYRLFDTAQMYDNEAALGSSLQKSGVARDEIFLISKVDNCNQGYERTMESFGESLARLQTGYLDSFLIHWPGQNRDRILDTWRAMERLYRDGLVRSIGVSNFEQVQLEFLLEHCEIAPAINQIEHTPLMHDEPLLSYCSGHGIQVMAWGPLLRGKMQSETIGEMAQRHGKSPAQILIRWNLQQGIVPIPKTRDSGRLLENISVFDFQLSPEEMETLNGMNQFYRTSHNPLEFDF